ncbi:MAG: DUF167 domain-containing protein [Candidatus Nomurabacteria bacterium]|jgi:uncharacterized protein YggU (UPF0235/DUF167 family)|nr:DUF167 domain-containing protein [Candidatus Nomurabacteria bacterium]
MKYAVFVKAGVKRDEGAVKMTDGTIVVTVRARPIDGVANAAVISLLSNYFNVAKSNIKVVSGHKSRKKIIDVIE